MLSLCDIITPKYDEIIKVKLITKAEDDIMEKELEGKYEHIKNELLKNNINFDYEFNPNIHDRSIETDTGWKIKPGRGLDFFQKPDTLQSYNENEQLNRKCKETEIDIFKV